MSELMPPLVRWPPGVCEWIEQCRDADRCRITRVPFQELRGWTFEEGTGNLVHHSGKFFSVEGLEVRSADDPVPWWHQPIIRQPEIGILGILVRRHGGHLECLMQAKMEPGNVNGIQLSPTVQATRSNYTRVHGGASIPYLDYFRSPGRGRVLVDVQQSEQGSWFLRKRNRNMVVQVFDEPEPHENFRWIRLDAVKRLFGVDNLINMDARTVLSCLTAAARPLAPEPGESAFDAALRRSSRPGARGRHSDVEVLSWFTENKSRHELTARRIPLAALRHWRQTGDEIVHEHNRHFRIIGVEVASSDREVPGWTQPMLQPSGRGVVAFLAKQLDGVLHLLVQARRQPGLADVVEMAPTVHCRPENHAHLPAALRPPFLDTVLRAPPDRIRYDSVLSEEGGRFYHADNRYLVVEAEDDFPVEPPREFCWLTVHQLSALLRHSHYVNVEARSLAACVNSLARTEP